MSIPLNIKTDYSLQKSLIKVTDLINFCLNNNITICGICDDNLSSSIEFYKLCQANNIKPIIGLELNIANYKFLLYCQDYLGYKNLLKINSLINTEMKLSDIENYLNNLLIVLIDYDEKILDFFEKYQDDIYFGIDSNDNNVDKNNSVFVREIRCLAKEDYEYLKVLYDLSGNIDYPKEDCYYCNNDYDNSDFASRINLEIPFDKRYIPKYKEGIDSTLYLTKLANLGLQKRLNNKVNEIYQDRLNYELEVIIKMNFVDYFLIVYDYVLYAKKNNILVGPGRGSAAGSLVSYALGITDIDPIKYNLLFERFLNVDRITMPDIDIDFDNTKREEVINYVKNKYGKYRVSGGIAFATYKTRLVLRDLGKYYHIEERLLNKFLGVINKDMTLKENLQNDLVKKYLNEYQQLNKMYLTSLKLEGLKKNISQHAAGVVIADRELDEIIPMYFKNEVMLTGVSMEYLEDMGLLKMDFLALKNLSTIAKIISNIPNFDLKNIDLEDKEVYELLSSANTDGIFQFETPIFKKVLPKLKPKCFNDLIAAISLVRPGPSKELETYIRRKDTLEKIDYYDDRLKDILKDTYGIIIYQEQVIMILNKMAAFSNQEADNIRIAMSKKKKELLDNYKEEFIKRSINNGYQEELARNIYENILRFASYGFNKAHSVSYALISYQMAFLKVHYKYLFIFSFLDEIKGNDEKLNNYLIEIKKDGIRLVKPSWNYSFANYYINGKFLYLPYKIIKELNSEIINKIIEERQNGKYENVYDVFKRTCNFINRNTFELLIRADMFKEFKINIETLLNNLDNLINYGSLAREINDLVKPSINYYEEMSVEELREDEKKIFGMYISNHPASRFARDKYVKIENLDKYLFKKVKVAVIIEKMKKIKTKNKDEMAFILVSDETGGMEFTIFPETLKNNANLALNKLYVISGEVTKRFAKINFIVNKIEEV